MDGAAWKATGAGEDVDMRRQSRSRNNAAAPRVHCRRVSVKHAV